MKFPPVFYFSFWLLVFFWQINSFFNVKIKHPKTPIKISDAIKQKGFNLAEFLSYKVADALGKKRRRLYNAHGSLTNFLKRTRIGRKEVRMWLMLFGVPPLKETESNG